MSRTLLLLLSLVLPTAVVASDFFTIWPEHPEAPGRPGPREGAVEREWDVRIDMRGIVANTAAIEKIGVRLPDGERTFFMRRIALDAGFELVGEDDFEIRPGARDEEISYSWYGEAEAEQMTIAVHEGVMSATITGSRGVYSLIRQRALPVLQRIDTSRISTLEPGGDGRPVPPKSAWSPPMSLDGLMPKLAIDNVDVLVVHTAAALTAAGSLADLNARVAESFVQIQDAMTVSGMSGVRVRNVLSGSNLSEAISYNEVPGNTCAGPNVGLCRWTGHRIWLRTSTAVASLRNTHGADLVVMLVGDNEGPVGVAYVQRPDCGVTANYENTTGCDVGAAYSAFAFSVVNVAFTTSFQVFAHEVGHQFGMDHQEDAFGSLTPAYPWSYAKTKDDLSVQTVVGGFSLARTLQFSNPNVPFIGSGEASGETLQFNARTGACLAATMSGFRTPGQLLTLFSDGFELLLIPIGGC